MIKRVLLSVLILASAASVEAKKVSDVLGSGGGTFDPWDTTKWAAWYSSGKLNDYFEIDCNVTFATGTSSSSPWKPSISSTLKSTGYIFYISSTGRGVTVNGNNAFIDLRPSNHSVSEIRFYYSWWYDDSDLFGISKCFYVSQSLTTTKPATVIKNLWLKGFIQAIRTGSSQRHPLTIQNCNFRFNQWGVYLSGEQTTVTDNSILQGVKGGIYLGSGSGRNYVTDNTFQDNNIDESTDYGDMAIDTCHHSVIENNTHSASAELDYYVAIKMYRNMGESGNLRENAPNYNIIRNNSITGYSVGYEIGNRMGRLKDSGYDLSQEAREYANYNLFENNTFTNTNVGVKINTSGNTIRGNTFTNVTKPIVLHCVFYSLTETTINDQAGDNVYYWLVDDDYDTGDYPDWFPYQDDRNSGVTEAEKVIHIRSDYGSPNFQNYTGTATIIKTPSLTVGSANRVPDLSGDQYINFQDISSFGSFWKRNDSSLSNDFCNGTDFNFDGSVNTIDLSKISNNWLGLNDLADVYSTGATPIDIAVSDFWVNNPGEEIAVIWDSTVSNIDNTNYYSIIIYDSNGIEINRCGRSSTKWEAITAGNFISLTGSEIAAVPSTAVSGKYPVYIFSRGRKDPNTTLMTTNTTKIVDLAAGNFNTADTFDEIAAVYTGGSTSIAFCSAYAPTWTATTTGAASLTKIAAGNFDGTSSNGSEVAGINASSSIIYFYKPSATTHYTTAATSGLAVWDAIAGGEFNNGTSRDEVAVASSAASDGIYTISYYTGGATLPLKQCQSDVLGVRVKALGAGKFNVQAKLGIYEQADGFYSSNYAIINNWGEHVAALPTAAQTTAIPVFWVNSNPSNSQQTYLKVTPLFR